MKESGRLPASFFEANRIAADRTQARRWLEWATIRSSIHAREHF
jgi:hypothetical protein